MNTLYYLKVIKYYLFLNHERKYIKKPISQGQTQIKKKKVYYIHLESEKFISQGHNHILIVQRICLYTLRILNSKPVQYIALLYQMLIF